MLACGYKGYYLQSDLFLAGWGDLKQKGFSAVAVGGGTATYNAFLDKDLVTEICFNIVPVITGSGGVLGMNPGFTTRFTLTDQALLADGCMRLNYRKYNAAR